MYRLINIISIIVRQCYLPNPYENIIDNSGFAMLFNILIGGIILHKLSFWITGIYYDRGDLPAVGSLSYLIWYIINTAIFTFVGGLISNFYWFFFVLVFIYAFIFYIVFKLSNRHSYI